MFGGVAAAQLASDSSMNDVVDLRHARFTIVYASTVDMKPKCAQPVFSCFQCEGSAARDMFR